MEDAQVGDRELHATTCMYTIVPGSVLPVFKSYLAKAVAIKPTINRLSDSRLSQLLHSSAKEPCPSDKMVEPIKK